MNTGRSRCASYAPGASGNVATEEVVHLLHDMGHDTGIDLQALIEAARTITTAARAGEAGVAAEVLCTPARSIGASLNSAKVYLETSDMFAWTATVIILSMLMEFGLSKLLASVSRKYSDPAAEVSGND